MDKPALYDPKAIDALIRASILGELTLSPDLVTASNAAKHEAWVRAREQVVQDLLAPIRAMATQQINAWVEERARELGVPPPRFILES